MSKITLDQFKRNALGAETTHRARQAQAMQERLDALTLSAQASLGGVSTLLNVAWLDSVMEGLPSEIHLAAQNGYMSGIYVRRRGGTWSIEFAAEARHDAFPLSVSRTASDLADRLLRAMRIPHSPPAYRQLVDLAKWPVDDLPRFLAEVGGKLPLDVMRASVGHLSTLLPNHGVAHDSLNMAIGLWIDHVHNALGGDLASPLAGGRPSPAMIAAASSHAFVLVAMKANGVDVDGAMPEGHPSAGMTPLYVALNRGALHTAIVLLEKLGASPALKPNVMRETALHVLAQGVLQQPTHPYVEETRRLARWIAEAGIDPDARDHHGRTASGLIFEFLDTPNKGYELDNYAVDGLSKIMQILEDPTPNAPVSTP